jgi:hypothetical protein
MLDVEHTTSLNVTRPGDTVGVFKPHALRLSNEPELISDADAEILVLIAFTSPVSVRKLMVVGGGPGPDHPSAMRAYVNQVTIDFNGLDALRPAQQFDLPINLNGTVELTTVLHPFTSISSLALYFPANHGNTETTRIRYIGMQGEHTHYRREAVDTVYEVLCSGQDVAQEDEARGLGADLTKTHFH